MATVSVKSAVDFGLGSLADSRDVLKGLRKKKETDETETNTNKNDAQRWYNEILERTKDRRESLKKSVQERSEKAFERLGVPTRTEFGKIQNQVKRLERQLKKG